MTAAGLAHALKGRRHGSYYMARCVVHGPDNNPSMAITEKDGNVLVKCHAGCSQRDVIEALKARGLWESSNSREFRPQRSVGKIVACYDYCDEYGEVLYQAVRKEPKNFFQRRPDGHGGWESKAGERQVLYRLPEVLEAPIVFVVEGEKDCETLRSWGFVATTNVGGANAPWLREYTATLSGREVILIPDNDEPGRQHVIKVARALVGHVAKLTVLELEGAKDITEWFERGHSEVELIAKLEDEAVSQ